MPERTTPALLCTADGEVFEGRSVGAVGVATGEAVFNTSMTGYQEILTDPSYAGQVVVMTASHIGNYGLTGHDDQSSKARVSGFVTRATSRRDSSWRSEGSVREYLHRHGVVAISDVDTRRLTRHIREKGAMPVAMGADIDRSELLAIAASAPTMDGQDLVSGVTTDTPYRVEPSGPARGRVVAIDLGIKRDILHNLTSRGFTVDVVPAHTGAEAILDLHPDGVFVSNGPGDPEPLLDTTRRPPGLVGQGPGVRDLPRAPGARPRRREPGPTSWRSGTMAAITPCAGSTTGESKSPPRTTDLRSTCGACPTARRRPGRVWSVPSCSLAASEESLER